jgi:3-oxoisoapionate kinase
VILHAARGPDDPRIAELRDKAATVAGPDQPAELLTGEGVGTQLGRMLDAILSRCDLPRAVTTGGDTSGRIAAALGVQSLGFVAPMAPGSPLCQLSAPGRAADGRQMVFKGGQVGRDDLLLSILRGHT